MARLVVLHNPLDPSRRRLVDVGDGVRLFDWLDENEPAGVRGTREVFVNGLCVTDPDYVTAPGDEILVSFRPGTGIEIGVLILQAAIGAAIGLLLSFIFKPSKPQASKTPSPSQVYGIAPARNAARLGEPIPVIYGSVIALPDFAAQPYVEFESNEQTLRAILCLGQGEHAVSEMLLGDSSASVLAPEAATYTVFGPADHASTFGNIAAATGVRENVVSSADVADQELLASNTFTNTVPTTWYWAATEESISSTPPDMPPVVNLVGLTLVERLALLPLDPELGTVASGLTYMVPGSVDTDPVYYVTTWIAAAYDPTISVPPGSMVPPPGFETFGDTKWVGWFESSKSGQHGTSIELDFVFSNGLYVMDNAGNLGTRAVTLKIQYQPIDDAGDVIGAAVESELTYSASSNTAQRYTHKIPVSLGRYLVRVSRVTQNDGRAGTSDRVHWTGLKFDAGGPFTGQAVYGAVTLVAVQLRASNAISGDAAASIRFRVTRRLAPPEGGPLAATVNPADAFADIVTAPYGGNRPRNGDELDFAALAAGRARWAEHNGFNAIFDQPSTVWEALSLSVQTVSAAPLPVGSRMSVIQDGPQPVRAQSFHDGNTVAGSVQITHGFDRDGTPQGVRVEFRDPRNFTAAAYMEPEGAPDYETLPLFGCTSREVAEEHARRYLNRRRLQRTEVSFVTELEGLNCLPGDRIGIQARMARWAQGARVFAVAGLVLTLDAALTWTAGQFHALQLRDQQGRPHTVRDVVRGASDFEVIVPALPFEPVGYGEDMEPTLIAFGIDGQEITDWTVTTMHPQGDRVTIRGVNYSPGIWAEGRITEEGEPRTTEDGTRRFTE